MDFWENLISSTGYSCPKVSLLQIIRQGVKVYDFFRNFKGNFKGRCYDSAVPPVSAFPNSPCCRWFCDFIDPTVMDWIPQHVIKVHGEVGVCPPPHLGHVPSSGNIADAPSHALSDSDCSLSTVAWARVQSRFGQHTLRLMSLDSNCCRGRDGNFLPHYSPWPTPNSSGTNVFAQPIPSEHNVYVFPPFILVGPLLHYFLDQRQRFTFTIIVPRFHPRRYWWAILQALAVDSFVLGRKGDPSVL